jgi:hypothetical protein
MIVHYRGFTLTQAQVDQLLSHALDQLLAGLAPTKRRGAKRRYARRAPGRKPMTAAERKAASKRMSDMWKKRRAQGKTGTLDT